MDRVLLDAVIDDRYRVVRRLGAGGQGRVWLVHDQVRGDVCVLKAVHAEAGERALVAEFRHLGRLAHPALVPVRDVGRVVRPGPLPAGTLYVTADFVEGVPLLVATQREEPARLLWSVAADVAAALAVIHGAGLVHHDVAPDNVLVIDGGDRAVLLDLGLCGVRGRGGAARGTPAYLAPEALAGRAEPRSDLWSLGAALHHAATGAAVFARPTLAATARAVLIDEAPPVTGVPAPLAALIARLLAKDVTGRPASALALLGELDAIAGAIATGTDRPLRPRPAPAVRAPAVAAPLVGAGAAIDAIAAALASPAMPVVRVWGPPGADAGAVVTEALRRHQLAMIAAGGAARPVLRGGLDAVAAALGATERLPQAVAAADGDRVRVIDLGDDPRADDVVRAAVRGHAALIAVVTRAEAPAPRPGTLDVAVGPVTVADLQALAADLLGRAVPAAWAGSLHRASGGLAALAADIVRLAAAAPDALAIEPESIASGAAAVAAAFAERALAALPAERALLAALAVWRGRAVDEALIATAGADPAALGALIAAGTVQRSGDAVALAPALASALEARLPADERAALHAAAAAWAESAGAPRLVRAEHLAGAPPDPAHAPELIDGAGQLLARGRSADALAMARVAVARADRDDLRAAARVTAARAALVLGHYAEAAELAEAAGAPLLLARIRQRAGDLDAAEAVLAALAAAPGAGDDDEIAGAYARLLVSRARYAEAARVAGRPDLDAPRGALRLEAAGLAALYQGDLDGADRAFGVLETVGEPGRARALRGLVAQQRGDLVASASLFAAAAAASREAGDVHAAAVADLNAGTALSERGRFAEALPVLAAAAADLADLGTVAERAAVEFNRGNALLGLGDLAGATSAATAALELARGHGLPHMAVFATLLGGDVARRAGEVATARQRYADAEAGARDAAAPHALLCALLPRAELAAPDEATALLAEAAALAGSPDDRDRVELSRGRAELAAGRETAARIDALLAVAERARQADRLERAFRATAIAAAIARSAAPARARGLASDAAELHGRIAAAAAPAWRLALADDPDGRGLVDLLAPAPPTPAPTGEVHRLRRLLALSRRLNAEGSLDRLLDDVIDAAIELTAAERGFLLLRGGRAAAAPGAALEVVVARGFATRDLDERAVSRSIADSAAESGEPVITLDAGLDERFGAAASVAAFRLRSVMAVPLRQKGQVTGCLYVDHRLRGGAFDDDAASLLLDLADIAAVAVDNARLAADLRRQKDEIDALNRRLAADIADRDAELVAVRARLVDRDALAYPTIVGRSPAVVAMLERIDRAARAALPVVIVGESGTGKELVARALHDHGPRRDRSFVAVNCSAMPEALLESELFGHVRGAFTGADRDRRGLFEVADGGTLFLDEVADTGPAMQAKLLRVLQDGTFRRVGDERVRRADVRVVAASQQPLAALAAAGRFRDDLRFRLEVITIDVPALRARQGDVPLLVEHILARVSGRVAGKARPTLTRAAQRALAAHAWPGNVRELENALARAVALGGDVIDVDDLPEAVVATSQRRAGAQPPPDDLTLKPAVASLERAYLDAALARAGGNQTVAARLLGLSRFGLQKKLRRLADGAESDDRQPEGDSDL